MGRYTLTFPQSAGKYEYTLPQSMTLPTSIVNLIESGPCHLYVNTPTLTLPSTRRQEPCPPSKTPVWCHDGGRCLCLVRNTIGRGVCRKTFQFQVQIIYRNSIFIGYYRGPLCLPCHICRTLESSLFSLPLYVSLYMRQTSI